ncbi:MAG: PKD domain-containing protein [Saprospiraceae bacterium]
MRLFFLLFALFFTAAASAQTALPTKGCFPLTVNFTAPPGSSNWFWEFGDGSFSNQQNPSKTYSADGTFSAVLRNGNGGPVVGTVSIEVYPKPEVLITSTPESGCRPLPVQFADVSTFNPNIQITGRSWTFGDGGSASGSNPQHIYTASGTFDVSLELTTNFNSCNIVEVFNDEITVANRPQVSFTTNPNPPAKCDPPLTVAFTNTSPNTGGLTWAWNFGNGNTSAQFAPSSQTYSQNGNFPVTLTVTDAVGCSAEFTVPVTVGSPTADFTFPNDTICLNEPTQPQNNSSAGNYFWEFGPNAFPQVSALVNPFVVFTQPGLQSVKLTVTDPTGVCSGTVTKQIFVEQVDPNFTAVPTYSCSDKAVFNFNALSPTATSWLWTFSDGSTSNIKNPTYNWVNPDQTGYTSLGFFPDTVRLEVTSAAGCKAETFKIDTVWRPNARFMPDKQHGCAPLTVIFADSSRSREPIVEWTWLFDDGSPAVVNSTKANVTHTFTQPGEYNVRLIIRNNAGCVDTSYNILIEVGEKLKGQFAADKVEVCPGDTIQFTDLTNDPRIDAWHFATEDDRMWHCFDDPTPIWAYNSETGPMDVTLHLEYNGCFDTTTVQDYILVKGPIAKAEYKTTCADSRTFDFTDASSGATQITWQYGPGLTSNLPTFSHTYTSSDPDTVVLVAENPGTGCPISTDTIIVYPTQVKADFDLPFIICGQAPYQLDGSLSKDVNATCYKGYTWFFDWQRPIRTDQVSTEFVFTEPGFHRLWLEVEDINGCRDTIQDSVQVYMRNPNFIASDYDICLPTTVFFTDQSTADTTIVSWDWDFGDGSMGSGQAPSHTFSSPPLAGGSFLVTLTIRDKAGCPTSIPVEITLYEPESNIVTFPNPPNVCLGEKIIFSASDFTAGGSNLTWAWNFGDGGTSNGQTVEHTYAQAGSFTTTVNFTEVASGCQGSTTVNANVQAYPVAAFTTSPSLGDTICAPAQIQFTNSSQSGTPVSVLWTFPGGITSAGNTANFSFEQGTHTVKMTATTQFGCADDTEQTFTAVRPDGDFEVSKAEICVGDEVTFTVKDLKDVTSWSWDFGDGTTAPGGSPVTHEYGFKPPSGSILATLVLTLSTGNIQCPFLVQNPVNFSKVDANFSVPSSQCFGLPFAFTDLSVEGDQHIWNFGDGSPTSSVANPTHSYPAVGAYTVQHIAIDLPLGCRDTFEQAVLVTPLPNLQAFGDTICKGDTAVIGLLSPVLNGTYVWAPTAPVLNPKNAPSVRVVVNQTTSFAVTVTDGMGCVGQDTAVVFVPSGFNGARNLDTLVVEGSTVVLPVLNDPFFVYDWEPKDPTFGNNQWSVTVKDTSESFELNISDPLGCFDEDYTFLIRVVSEVVWAPTAFTPNGDMQNNTFKLIPKGEEGDLAVDYLRIYNRWGELVFEGTGTDKTAVWDGTVDGKAAASDVYVWVASVKYLTGKEATLKGNVTLLR